MSDQRALFESAVVDRMKESGFLEIEIRTECLVRCDDGYQDEMINAGWHYWNAALAVDTPAPQTQKSGQDSPHDRAENHDEADGHAEKTEHSDVGVKTPDPSEPPARPLVSIFHEITPELNSSRDDELPRESLGSTPSIQPALALLGGADGK
ncbi:hypothetical protein G9X67_15030 [Rhizobium sp. WYCCWR 11152]|uniref:hypothetical protein n=1 Tax=Rhizobium sp. WYCCWR 11152 TaxID=2692316 RepID=UPI001491AF35|nr:hypothetical protein [Rhizobium sp. WYCCWR 11152]NNU66585.1 hypothetical protein [Rhizobium sp. WYCCWR 11152]